MKFAATTLALVLATAIGVTSAFAADPAPAKSLTPQQQRMKDCNAQATGKTGDERKTFMSTCLKGGNSATAAAAAPAASAAAAPAAVPAKPMTQQQKMKACNVDANSKHLKGDERKSFMSTCLKGDNAAATPAH
jgi:hypothetical protein